MTTEVIVVETAEQRAAGWLAQAYYCWRDKRPDLVDLCFQEMTAAIYEGDRVIRWFEEEP